MEEENEEMVEQFSELGRYHSSNCPLRKKKKLLREQRKQRERVELKMDLPGVSIADEGETGMFSLRTIRGHQVRRGWNSLRRPEDLFVYLEGDQGLNIIFLVCCMITAHGCLSTHKYDSVRGDWEKKQEPCVSKARKKHKPNMKLGRFVNTIRILHMCMYHIIRKNRRTKRHSLQEAISGSCSQGNGLPAR